MSSKALKIFNTAGGKSLWPIRYNINVCDHAASELMVHFTKHCDNHCAFCVDKNNEGVSSKKPDVDAILATCLSCLNYVNTVTISGGEPMLFMDDVEKLIDGLKQAKPNIEIILNTAIPKTCFDNHEQFMRIYDKCDVVSISGQHADEKIADKIRQTQSQYDRQKFYSELPNKDKVRMCFNVHKPYLTTKDDILRVTKHYNDMGFHFIRICEMFDYDQGYISIPDVLGIKMKSPFASGCSQTYDISKLIPSFTGKFVIKRVCFLRTKKQKASIWDGIKMITRPLFFKKYFFGVVHEDGTISNYWL